MSRDFTLKIFDVATGRLLESFALGRRSLKSVCFVSSELVLVGDYWGSLIQVELSTGRSTRKTIARNGISSLGRAGDRVVAASYDGCIYGVRPDTMEITSVMRAMRQRIDHHESEIL